MSGDKKNVLLVEDESICSKVIAQTLEQAGYQVTTCENGVEALQTLSKSADYGLIVLDRLMPEMDGLAFLKQMQEESFADIPVVMLTSVDDGDEIVNALEAGAYDYLTKPVNPEELLELVNRVFE